MVTSAVSSSLIVTVSLFGGPDRDVGIARRDAVERDGDRLVVFQQIVVDHGDVDRGRGRPGRDRDDTGQGRVIAVGRGIAGDRVADHRVGIAGLARG